MAQDDKTLTRTSTNFNGDEVTSVYHLDGSEANNVVSFGGNPMDRISTVAWVGKNMVITTSMRFNGRDFIATQTWSLDASGNLVIELSGRRGVPPTKTTYKKS